MPKMNFSRFMWIDSTEEKVWERIIDFHEWKIWSPWAILEPSSKVDVSEDGKFYKWVGKHIGEGSMKIVDFETNKRVEIDLNFLKPLSMVFFILGHFSLFHFMILSEKERYRLKIKK